ncbi:MAG: type I secretion system permease/ATPase [Proteobacteria bacterium]|nr:type I secretion system permease/ATPase [Pseudomonadota bacterium]
MLRPAVPYLATAGAFSLAINLLYLAGPLYMLQVYDRVVPSSSETTLVMVTLALLMAYAALAGLDAMRARVLTRASVELDRKIASAVVTASIDQPTGGARSQSLRDFDTFRQFVSGAGIHALFDLPWAPVYIAVIFMLHWSLGAFALGCSVLLVLMALLNEWLVGKQLGGANAAAARNYAFTEMSLRNTEAIRAMGMTPGLLERWSTDRDQMLGRQVIASDRAGAIHSIIKFLRLSMQSVILGLGAYLVIEHALTAGAMFAASLLLGRALQPVEQVVGAWRGIVAVRAAFRRLDRLFAAIARQGPELALPKPTGKLSVEGVSYVAPGSPRPLLRNVSFELEAGEILGVIGPSGAGKSTLARHLVGVLTPTAGTVRLDGADVAAWSRNGLGAHVGYLPQDIELFADTVACNINRFQPGDDPAVLEAARMAGVHELILRLSDGYNTAVGEGGAVLSGGIRQRLGLARAVYASPSLVVLDEPSSNLDADGDGALRDCLVELKQRGVTVVLISHRPASIVTADKLLLLKDGVVELFGPRLDVLGRLAPRPVNRLVSVPAQARSA